MNEVYPGSQLEVAAMLPYLGDSTRRLTIDGQEYEADDPASRRALYSTWLRGIARESNGLRAVKFVGGYWLNESLLPGDSATIRSAAEAAQQQSLRLLWIPSYHARGAADWRELGFTDAWYQPNFFFDPRIRDSRVDSAADFASARGMGLELEFDRRLLSQPDFASRLAPYLSYLQRHTLKSIAVYDGAGALVDLLTSGEPRTRATAKQLVAILCPNHSVI